MVSIQNKVQAAGASIASGVRAAGQGVKNGANAIARAVVRTSEVIGSAPEQRKVAGAVNNGVDRVYTKIGCRVARANEAMEGKGEARLARPDAKLADRTFTPVEVKGSTMRKAGAHMRNALGTYHKVVAIGGEQVARGMGVKAHAFTHLALAPIAFLAKLFQVEGAGRAIQNAVSLAVGFTTRYLTLGVTQLAHALPYITAIAAVAAISAGIYLGGTFLVGAVGITIAALGTLYVIDKLVTGGVILALQKKVKGLAKDAANTVAPQGPSLAQRARAALTNNKGKVASAVATAAVAGLAAASYYHGVPAPLADAYNNVASAAAPYAAQAGEKLSYAGEVLTNTTREASDFVSANYGAAKEMGAATYADMAGRFANLTASIKEAVFAAAPAA